MVKNTISSFMLVIEFSMIMWFINMSINIFCALFLLLYLAHDNCI